MPRNVPGKLPWTLSMMLALSLCMPVRADFLKTLGKIMQLDQALFLFGDTGAEKRLGYLIARFTLMTNPINKDPAINSWVNGVFDRLKASAPRSKYTYRIHVINSPSINAFALPGGTVFIYRGMLDFVESDDELASVLGHEIAHAYRRHGMKRMQRNAVAQALISKLFKNQEDMQVLGQVATLFTGMSFSRKNEDESDAVGMQIALDAGYNPSGATTLWERMQARFGSSKGMEAFLSSHPSHSARVSNTRKWLAERSLPYQRTRGKSYDSKENQLVELAPNGGFEWQDANTLPQGWSILEGERSWIQYPAPMTLSGRAAIGTNVPRGTSLLIASGGILASTFRGPRVLSAHFHALADNPTVYLGLEYLDQKGNSIDRIWHAAQAHRLTTGKTELLRSPSISPEHFPKGTQKVRILIYLARLTGGSLLVDNVSLVPGTELDRQITALLPNGDLEDDANRDGVPDGFEVSQGSRDDLDSASGFASFRLEGPETGGPGTASLTTPLVPITLGRTYGFAFLTRTGVEGLSGRITWLGYDRRKQAIQGAPPPAAFSSSEEWRIARDKLTISPPPGIEIAYIRLRVEADLPAKGTLWLDDLRLEEVDQEGNPIPPPSLSGGKQEPTVVDVSNRRKPTVVDVSGIGKPGTPVPPPSPPSTPPAPVASKTAPPAPTPPPVQRAPVGQAPAPTPTKTFEIEDNATGQDADWMPRMESTPKPPRRAPR